MLEDESKISWRVKESFYTINRDPQKRHLMTNFYERCRAMMFLNSFDIITTISEFIISRRPRHSHVSLVSTTAKSELHQKNYRVWCKKLRKISLDDDDYCGTRERVKQLRQCCEYSFNWLNWLPTAKIYNHCSITGIHRLFAEIFDILRIISDKKMSARRKPAH